MKRVFTFILVLLLMLTACGGEKGPAPLKEGSFAATIGVNHAEKLHVGEFMIPEAAMVDAYKEVIGGVQLVLRGLDAEGAKLLASDAFDFFKANGNTMYKTVFSEASGRAQCIVVTEEIGVLPVENTYEVIYSDGVYFCAIDISYHSVQEELFLAGDTVVTITECTEQLKDFIGEQQ